MDSAVSVLMWTQERLSVPDVDTKAQRPDYLRIALKICGHSLQCRYQRPTPSDLKFELGIFFDPVMVSTFILHVGTPIGLGASNPVHHV